MQTRPVPRGASQPSEYQLFVKEHYGRIQRENKGVKQGVIMEILGREYRDRKIGVVKGEPGVKRVDDADLDAVVKELEFICLDD